RRAAAQPLHGSVRDRRGQDPQRARRDVLRRARPAAAQLAALRGQLPARREPAADAVSGGSTRMRRAIVLCLASSLSLLACTAGETEDRANDTVEDTRRFTGIWLYQFEGSTFIENETEIPEREVDTQEAAWLDYHP